MYHMHYFCFDVAYSIPYVCTGMEKVYPHDPENNKVMHGLPRQGQDVIVRFGKPICFDDLIQVRVRSRIRINFRKNLEMKDRQSQIA